MSRYYAHNHATPNPKTRKDWDEAVAKLEKNTYDRLFPALKNPNPKEAAPTLLHIASSRISPTRTSENIDDLRPFLDVTIEIDMQKMLFYILKILISQKNSINN